MKRIKVGLLFLVICLLCSGCTINYNLEIKNDTFVENIKINDTTIAGRSISDIYSDYNYWMPVYNDIMDPDLVTDGEGYNNGKIAGIEYHEKTITPISKGYYYTYKYIYPLNRFNHANSLRLAFGNPSVYVGSDYINIRTNKDNALCNYSYFESLKVNIQVDKNTYKVKQSNADKISGDVYTWNLNRNNCHNSIISLTLAKIGNNASNKITTNNRGGNNGKKTTNKQSNVKTTTSASNNSVGKLDSYVIYIFLVIMVIIGVVGYKWFINMKNKANLMDD